MKKLTKFLSLLLACIIAFSSVSMAAENAEEETTAAVQEGTVTQEETTAPSEETTTEEETTVPEEEETTIPSEETTSPEEETTFPEEETTTTPVVPEDETTTTPEEETTEPEIALPAAPTGLRVTHSNINTCTLHWDYNKDADGYDIFLKVDGEWVYQETTKNAAGYVHNLLCYSEYEIGVRSFILVGEEKYYSEDITTIIYSSPDIVPYTSIYSTRSYAGGIVFKWNTYKGINGYILYKRENNKWVKIATIRDREISEFDYKFPDMQTGKEYKFAIKSFVKGTKGTKYSELRTITMKFSDIGKTYIEATKKTSSSITLEWEKVEGASGYRLYKYNSAKKKYEAVKTTSALSYTVTNLEPSTKYRFRVRAYYKADGKTKWCTYSDSIADYTESKSVKASRISKLKKYFTDGDWSVKITGLYDSAYGNFDYTMAVKGVKIYAKYDFKNNKSIKDFAYLIDADKEKVYIIFDSDKKYAILSDEDAYAVVYSVVMMGVVLDLSEAKGVKAKTALYKGKPAIQEYYTDKETGMKKIYTFYEDKPVGLEVVYSDGSNEYMTISEISDTPSSSLFKVPSVYKKTAY